ncbi:histone deacetylase 8-like isoform X2 [Episyrphus balteatus]|uniref:histone deacetylase 8-like isoform X2 n=1 Tax=Episyrphus balteatus TaxID=286459 RepID=UPI002485A39C|nr:histone deacetylase 8-like isoform X2 [Episyrphus balteatus]
MSIKYVYSENLIAESNKNPAVQNRASMVHSLIKSYGLLSHMDILIPKICKLSDLRNFHSEDYLKFLKKCSDAHGDESELDNSESEDFGLGYDCPTWGGIINYATTIAGATITACDELCRGSADIVINWNGGWHHAHRDKAGGYCYVNDIVLGILELRTKFDRIIYIDLDVHHGDGVEEAFETTKRVFTLSFHQCEPGFFPGTGKSENCGLATGKGYAANFPYKSGISVCVIQCGGDALAGDPLGNSNLYPKDLIECIKFVMEFKLPLVLLGGGGYNFVNTSRYWTEITAAVCNKELDDDIPDENEFFLDYGPDYTIQIQKSRREDLNSDEYMEECVKSIQENIKKYNVMSV